MAGGSESSAIVVSVDLHEIVPTTTRAVESRRIDTGRMRVQRDAIVTNSTSVQRSGGTEAVRGNLKLTPFGQTARLARASLDDLRRMIPDRK